MTVVKVRAELEANFKISLTASKQRFLEDKGLDPFTSHTSPILSEFSEKFGESGFPSAQLLKLDFACCSQAPSCAKLPFNFGALLRRQRAARTGVRLLGHSIPPFPFSTARFADPSSFVAAARARQ